MDPLAVREISSCTIRPRRKLAQVPPQRCDLTPWDVRLLFLRYSQKGLLFHRPHPPDGQEEETISNIIERLKHSLSHVLVHFYPLAGRFVFENDASSSSSSHVYIDCNDAGAEFIHAVADISVTDVLAPVDVHPILQSFFPLNGAVNCDGSSLPLVALQLTELTDGFFLACSFNHAFGDGSSFWHFFKSWSEIYKSNISGKNEPLVDILRPPDIHRWFPSRNPPPVSLPFSSVDEFIERHSFPRIRQRFFHLTRESVARLKAKANEEYKTDRISSFQALSAHVWISITRARALPADQITVFGCPIDNRSRLQLPLSRDYLGNCTQIALAIVNAGELLANGLGWAAWQLHQCVGEHNDDVIRSTYEGLGREFVLPSKLDNRNVGASSSPRFDLYGVDFGWEKAVAVRSGWDNKFDGMVLFFPGREGGGSMDLELCLVPEVMCALESDKEFMDLVFSFSPETVDLHALGISRPFANGWGKRIG